MVNENIEFRDEFYGDMSEQKLSMKEIILRHIKKISDLSCREFTGGYWDKKPIKTSDGILFMEIYHEDVREAYCNAVDFFMDVIYPMSDKTLKEYLEEFEGHFEKKKREVKSNEKEKELDIKDKLKLKRQTFRQINLMFERCNFWKGGSGIVNEGE